MLQLALQAVKKFYKGFVQYKQRNSTANDYKPIDPVESSQESATNLYEQKQTTHTVTILHQIMTHPQPGCC